MIWGLAVLLFVVAFAWWRTFLKLTDVRRRFEAYAYRMRRELPTDASLLTKEEMGGGS